MQLVRFLDPAGSETQGHWKDGPIMFGGIRYDADEVRILAPSEPSKSVCLGLNYADHAPGAGMEIPDRPLLLLKPPECYRPSRQHYHPPGGGGLNRLRGVVRGVIGEQCPHVDEVNAETVVVGYTWGVDLSKRDDQDIEQNWVRG